MREQLARQLWFWRGQDTEPDFDKTFEGPTHTVKDWNELLIPEERDMWLERADKVITVMRNHHEATWK